MASSRELRKDVAFSTALTDKQKGAHYVPFIFLLNFLKIYGIIYIENEK